MHRKPIIHIILVFAMVNILSAQDGIVNQVQEITVSDQVLLQYATPVPQEHCFNGIDDDGDGLIDCADGDCQVLTNGGFEDVPTATSPNSFVTFPPFPTFMGSWAAVNIDGEVFFQSPSRPAFQGDRYASLLQNAGANPRTPWNETSWGAGGYDRFLFIANTFPSTDYNMVFFHAGDSRYAYYGDRTLVQIQSMDSDYYYDTLIVTPGFFDWTQVDLPFSTDDETNSVAILFSAYSESSASVLVDGMKLCGSRVPEVIAVDDDVVTLVNEPVNIEVLVNDLNLPESGVTISTSWSTLPDHGAIEIQPNGSITYTPDPGYYGPDDFNYTICNTQSFNHQCDEATVFIDVNQPFQVSTDTFTIIIPEDGSGEFCESYFEVEGVDVVNICNDGIFGNCDISNFPCVEYEPHSNYNGPDMVCVIMCNEEGCDTSIFVIEVQPVNDRPDAQDDVASTTQNEPVIFSILGNDYDMDNTLDISGVTILDEPSNGQVIVGPGSLLTYEPDEHFTGMDTLVYLVCDDGQPSLCDWAEVVISVYPESDTSYFIMNEDATIEICADTMTTNAGQNLDQTTLLYSPDGQSVPLSSQCLDYTPEEDFSGMDSIILVNCVGNICDTSVYILQILPVNDMPVAADDAVVTEANTSVIIDILANDDDPRDSGGMDPYSVEILDGPKSGFIENLYDGTVTYYPDADFTGSDAFTYLVCDLGEPMPALCDSAEVDVTITTSDEGIRCMIPESFSPNGDGLYDYFRIECADLFPHLQISIYDRFGNQMFQSVSGYKNDWDGTSMNNNKPLREGTYFWLIKFNDGHTKDRAGYVLIWR